MAGTHNHWLVLLSVMVATMASFVGLDLAKRIAHTRRILDRLLWVLCGAASMGLGIWTMHFIGMLGFHLPIEVTYGARLTLLSLGLAIAGCAASLALVSRNPLRVDKLLGGGCLVGAAIVSMHYTGMAAMRIVPPIRYDLGLVGLSVAIAVAASTFSLWSFYWLQSPDLVSVFWKKVGSALILGSAIYGMHYTGMMAASFAPDTRSVVDVHWALNPWILAVMLGAVSIVFLLGVLLISTYEEVRAGRLELRTAQLRRVAVRAENQVRDLSGRLVELQDAERRRLASELHDIVGQNLSALTTELAMLRNRSVATGASDLQRDLEDVSELAKQSVEAVRKVMAQLRPPGLDELGLAAALRWHAQAFESRTGIAVRVDIDESVPKPGALLEDALLRIYLEALTNIAKHAEAREVQVTLESRGERVTLAIADDGHGFAVESYQPGEGERWGLALMQERAAAMGGELQVRSAPVRGTEVVFSISKKLWS